MNTFLDSCRQLLIAQKVIRLVLGNPTADMDSCIGSCLLAYYYNFETPTIPVINYNKKHFKSHFESQELLTNFIFIEDVDINKYEIVVFDHNDIHYPTAIGVVDHHEDKGLNYKMKKIQNVGSATTLVGQMLMEKKLINNEIAGLIMKTILVDTFNFDIKQKGVRWTELDQQIYEYCNQIDKDFDRTKEYQHLVNLKYNVQMNLQLEFEELLLKDYKKFKNIGYSVIFVKQQELLMKWNQQFMLQECQKFIQTQYLTDLIVFYVYPIEGNIIQREMMLIGQNQELIIQELSKLNVKEIQSWEGCRQFVDVENVYSRKLIEPLISKLF